ncbi:hypothetical protein FA95DRAFT_1570589 [Auriscalpium vulgare]|uniref:Uncharacterized protein n=1 Tax=Auriscalpium vulgare TaxID=40419 RepID=A0ACB8S2M7_9AGAM|nr:hypothetical protein FA95DRAFT_1570589 [Auriscalpium vulgare]
MPYSDDSDDVAERADAFWTTSGNERLTLGLFQSSSTNDETTRTPQVIVDAEAGGTPLASPALISKLPSEILAHIFECLALVKKPHRDEFDWLTSERQSELGWIESATHVCRSWRAAALGHPALWRSISFELGMPWAREMLARARSAPLVIVQLHADAKLQTETDAMLLAHCAQIRELRTTRHAEGWRFVQPILASPVPALEVFEVIVDGESPPMVTDLFGGRADRLEKIAIRNCAFAWTCFPRSPLTQVVLQLSSNATRRGEPAPHQCPDLFLDFLAANPALEVLSLEHCLPTSDSYRDGSVVSLPRLRRISLSGRAVDVTAALGHIHLPSSTKLRLYCVSVTATSDECVVALSLAAAHLRSSGESIRMLKIQTEYWGTSTVSVDAQRENVSIKGMGRDALDFSVAMSWSPLGRAKYIPQSALRAIADALPLKYLQTLHLGVDCPEWTLPGPLTEVFGQSGAVQRLVVKGMPRLIKALAHPPQPDATTTSEANRGKHGHPHSIVLFPMLEHLHLTDIDFIPRARSGEVTNWLKKTLRWRRQQKMGLKTLFIEDCCVRQNQVKDLKQFVDDVHWDGITYSEEDDEEDFDEDYDSDDY